MFFSPSWLLLVIVTTGIGLAAQGYINSSYRRWSRVPLASGMSGAEVARRVLDSEGLGNVEIQQVGGNLTDHYDPRVKRLGLSQGVFTGASVASAGVAAHEAGHAIQDAQRYAWGTFRSALVPVANIGSQASFFLIFIGIFLRFTGLVWFGIFLYAFAVLFQIVTLPVELDASKRAIAHLQSTGLVGAEQIGGARQVLNAAALTYVAGALVAALQLLYFVGLARNR